MPEAADNLAAVCARTTLPIAIGEEWRTVFDAAERIRLGIAILQPEMGHTGITEFLRIGRLAAEHGKQLVPHATVGMGIFLIASLQASAALGVEWHEFQHSVMGKNQRYIDGQFFCERGRYAVPGAAGLGVEPSEEGFRCMTQMGRSG